MGVWVDTDFGFDDLWALLVLRHLRVKVDGVSLVAGNTPLHQVCRNALGARDTFDFDWTLAAGAARPLVRTAETAECVLGAKGMQSRQRFLPQNVVGGCNETALVEWLTTQHGPQVLALGPLTNLATLYRDHAEQAAGISRIVWMGGASAKGNHTPYAEFNAIADPDALAALVKAGAPMTVVDLKLCRQVQFSESDIPVLSGQNGELLHDLLGGYLDIALNRGRSAMAIYDPLAAIVLSGTTSIKSQCCKLNVCTNPGPQYGRTLFTPAERSSIQLVTEMDRGQAKAMCFAALQRESR